ncbi:MAG: hypothetical protein LAP21_17015, partial [Acidobacteriia bacterium]|nr:hypothetical protein [Terriglobia bacterium]
ANEHESKPKDRYFQFLIWPAKPKTDLLLIFNSRLFAFIRGSVFLRDSVVAFVDPEKTKAA